jgi:hypothetical protein
MEKPVETKEAFYDREISRLRKEKKGVSQQELMKKADGLWRNHQEALKKAQKAAKKEASKKPGK